MTKEESIGRPLQKAPNQMVQRLERKNKELQHLRDTLRSYICEPKTYKLFERYETLKRRLEHLHQKNQETIQTLKGRKVCMDEHWDHCRQQLTEYRELENSVLEYIGMAKTHG